MLGYLNLVYVYDVYKHILHEPFVGTISYTMPRHASAFATLCCTRQTEPVSLFNQAKLSTHYISSAACRVIPQISCNCYIKNATRLFGTPMHVSPLESLLAPVWRASGNTDGSSASTSVSCWIMQGPNHILGWSYDRQSGDARHTLHLACLVSGICRPSHVNRSHQPCGGLVLPHHYAETPEALHNGTKA